MTTHRLVLRPIGLADAEPIFDAYAQDSQVTRFLTWQPHAGVQDTRAYVARCISAQKARTYVLLDRRSSDLKGAFDLRQVSAHRMGYGYVLARSCWGHGLMTEVLSAVVTWALAQDGVWRIGDVCDSENTASARVMAKAGLANEGLLRRWAVHPNIGAEPRDCWSFAKVR